MPQVFTNSPQNIIITAAATQACITNAQDTAMTHAEKVCERDTLMAEVPTDLLKPVLCI